MKVSMKIKVELVKTSEFIDLELWKIPAQALPNNRVIKGFGTINIQESAYSVGNYLSIPFVYTEGTLAGYDDQDLLFNLPCAFGCSGSAIMNHEGYLVAVMHAGNNISTTLSIVKAFDTTKVLAIRGIDVQAFLGDLIE